MKKWAVKLPQGSLTPEEDERLLEGSNNSLAQLLATHIPGSAPTPLSQPADDTANSPVTAPTNGPVAAPAHEPATANPSEPATATPSELANGNASKEVSTRPHCSSLVITKNLEE